MGDEMDVVDLTIESLKVPMILLKEGFCVHFLDKGNFYELVYFVISDIDAT